VSLRYPVVHSHGSHVVLLSLNDMYRPTGGFRIALHIERKQIHDESMLIRRENPGDVDAIRGIARAAFMHPGRTSILPPEAGLIDELRSSDYFLPTLSLVAVNSHADVVGHVLCTRGRVDSAPVLALGPLAVHPDQQRSGVGLALMHAILGAAEALDEPLVGVLGDPGLLLTLWLSFERGV
jgi:putative acetyltransferase